MLGLLMCATPYLDRVGKGGGGLMGAGSNWEHTNFMLMRKTLPGLGSYVRMYCAMTAICYLNVRSVSSLTSTNPQSIRIHPTAVIGSSKQVPDA